MAGALADAGCDLLVMEMMMDVERATRVTEAALATGLPVWVGISTSQGPGGTMTGWDVESEENGRLPEGYTPPPREALETIIDALVALGPEVGGHHAQLRRIHLSGLESPLRAVGRPVMAYPEALRFDSVSHLARVTVEPEVFASHLPALGGGRRADHRRLLLAPPSRMFGPWWMLCRSGRGRVPAPDPSLSGARAFPRPPCSVEPVDCRGPEELRTPMRSGARGGVFVPGTAGAAR